MAKGQKKQKKTKLALQKLFEAFRNGLNRESACAYAGVAKRTFYQRLEDDQEFCTEVEHCEDYWIGIVENQKTKLVKSGYRPAIEKELKSKKREVYGDKSEVDQNIRGVLGIVKIGQIKE